MHNLDEVYEKLRGVLDQSLNNEGDNLWSIYFHFWNYLYSLNQNIEEASSLADKIALIELFIAHHKDLTLIESVMTKRIKASKQSVLALEALPLLPNVECMKDLLNKEKGRLASLMKKIKLEKNTPTKTGQKLRKRPAKQKWIRS